MKRHGVEMGSRIFIVGVSVEKICDHPQHRLEKAYFVTGFAAKDSKLQLLSFQGLFLFVAESGLPC
jgi:hypothetical protein